MRAPFGGQTLPVDVSASHIAQRAFAPDRRPIRPQLSISVIVPTYRRPLDLARCLTALERQARRPDRVIVVIRADDLETQRYLQMRIANDFLTVVFVEREGVVAALNAGLDAADGDIVAFTDDDARPHADWLERIEAHFHDDASIGGVGGRDYVKGLESEHESSRVGEIQWFGRQIGNHHLGNGPARDVEVLKGVNMSFRSDAIRGVHFDERLRGSGAQVHNELLFCFAVSRGGWRLVYDPAVAVDHFPAERFDDIPLIAEISASDPSATSLTLAVAEVEAAIDGPKVWFRLRL